MVDHAYCINLERSTDRRKSAQVQFDREGLDVEFFKATDGKREAPDNIFLTKPEWGCAMSHVRIWRDIVDRGYEVTLVFEDDIELKPDFLQKLNKVLSQLPEDWDFVNIGSSYPMRIDYSDYTDDIKVGQSITTHAYLIRLKCAQKLSLIEPNHLKDQIDTFMYRYPSYNLHVKDSLADQPIHHGTTIGFFRAHDYSFMFRKWWLLVLIVLCIVWLFLSRRKIWLKSLYTTK